jgi:hypothetical protein
MYHVASLWVSRLCTKPLEVCQSASVETNYSGFTLQTARLDSLQCGKMFVYGLSSFYDESSRHMLSFVVCSLCYMCILVTHMVEGLTLRAMQSSQRFSSQISP